MEIEVNTTNGVERKNRDFKYEYLLPHKDKFLSGMLSVLIEQFHPEKYAEGVNTLYRFSFVSCSIVNLRYTLKVGKNLPPLSLESKNL